MPVATSSASVESIRAALQCGKPHCDCHKPHGNVHCPAHDDSNPSFSVDEKGGTLVVKCFANCDQPKVIDALKGRGLWPESKPAPEAPQQSKLVATYEYRNADGKLVALKGRFETGTSKTFHWKLPNSQSWNGLDGGKISEMPLWGTDLLANLPADEDVFLVEGEKAATACREQGLFALTHGGGASITDFGNSLEALTGRRVVLWPDNDEAGRRYMARVHAALRPIAKSVTLINPSVPEKGDAYDFFKFGGSVAEITEQLPPTQPAVDYLAHDAVRVRMPTAKGVLALTFTNMEKTARELSVELEVQLGSVGEPFPTRLNLLSLSQVTDLRRTLELVYGKDLGWPSLLNLAISKARKAYLEQDRAVKLIAITDPGPPQFLIPKVLPAGVPTVWFGDGSSGKTYLALRAALSVATDVPFGNANTMTGPVLFVDYENNEQNFKFRMRRLYRGIGLRDVPDVPMSYWPARGIPLIDQIDAIRQKVERDGIMLVIIDSAAAACGGKPEDADIALQYFRALAKLGDGVTTLTIAHIPKGGDCMRPFGSIFWENQPRRTINFQRTEDEDSDEINVGLYFRKVNEGKKPKPVAFKMTFDGEDGQVEIDATEISEVPELAAKQTKRQQVWNALDKARSTQEIAEITGLSTSDVSSTCRAAAFMFVVLEAGGGRGKPTIWGRRIKT